MQKIYTIDLLRHGETMAGRCFLGSTDALLTEQGEQKMQDVLKGASYAQVISSPLKRCADFSEVFSRDKSTVLHIEHDLREMHFGDWEGRTSAEIWDTQQAHLSGFWNDPLNNTPPNGEAYIDFTRRVDRVFLALLEKPPEQGDNTLVVVHAGVIRQVLASILSLPFQQAQKIHIDYGGLSRIEYCEGHSSVRFVNCGV